MARPFKRWILRLVRAVSTARARRRVARYGVGLTVNYPCAFTSKTVVGRYCHFNGMKVRGSGQLVIGDYFHSGEDILVITQNHNYRDPAKLPYDEIDIPRDVKIGAYVWVGSRAVILPGAQLGDGCIVQAGAVVAGSFPPNAIVGGNPATVIGHRDAEIVRKLVSQGQFLH